MSSYDYEEIVPGDLVAVRHGIKGRQEGLVVGSHIDYAVRVLYTLCPLDVFSNAKFCSF